MYITLFIIVLIVGLLMVLLPSKAIKNLVNQNGVLVVLRLLGIIMCVASSVTIYALVAGKIVLSSFANNTAKNSSGDILAIPPEQRDNNSGGSPYVP